MDLSFISSLREKAKKRHAHIGIGIWNANPGLIESLQSAQEYADLVIVGNVNPCCDSPFDIISTDEPWKELPDLLAKGEIDGAVRGNLPAGRTMKALAGQFNIKIRRLALMELAGWAFFLGPVGIDEGETVSDRLGLVMDGAKLLEKMGIKAKASVLSGGRMEDRGRSRRVDQSLDEGELIAQHALKAGVDAKHKGILIESCYGDDIVVAPEGVSGNLIFRTILLLCKANSFGAPVMMDKIFVDSSRARSGFDGPVMLASGMVGTREHL